MPVNQTWIRSGLMLFPNHASTFDRALRWCDWTFPFFHFFGCLCSMARFLCIDAFARCSPCLRCLKMCPSLLPCWLLKWFPFRWRQPLGCSSASTSSIPSFLEGSQTSSTCPQLLRPKAEVSLMLVFMTLLMGTMSLAQVGRAADYRIWWHSFLVSENSYMHFLSCGMGSPVAAQYWRRCDRLRQCSDSLRRRVVHQGAAEIGRFCSHGSSSEWWEVFQVGAGAKWKGARLFGGCPSGWDSKNLCDWVEGLPCWASGPQITLI